MKWYIVSALVYACLLVLGADALSAPSYADNNSVPADGRATPAYPPADSSAGGAISSKINIDENYVLRPGDKVGFSVVEERKPPLELIVLASGEIEVPYIGRFPVAGKTCQMASAQLKTELEKKYFKRATVTLALNQAGSMPLMGTSNFRVYFTGAVALQGVREFPADNNITVSKAVLMIGGFAQFADQKKVQLIRRLPNGKTQITQVNVRDLLRGKAGADPVLQAEDMIRVPEKFINF